MIELAPRRFRAHSFCAFVLVAGIAVCAWTPRAAAEVRISEAGGRLTVEAHDATVRQIIEALSASHPIKLHTTDALTRNVTGTYSGSLSRILARILDGYDHVVHATASGIELDVVAAAPAVRTTISAASTVTMVPAAARGVSGNLDLDEETTASARSRAVNVPAPPARPVRPIPVAARNTAGAPRVSGNVDLDEETSR